LDLLGVSPLSFITSSTDIEILKQLG